MLIFVESTIISEYNELYCILTLYAALPPVSCRNFRHHWHPSIDQKYCLLLELDATWHKNFQSLH